MITDNPDDKFGVKAMFWTPDKNLLLHLNQIHVSQIPLFVRQDYHCNALLDTRKLGIISSVFDPNTTLVKNIYPNPVNDFIILQGDEYINMKIKVFDQMGRLVLSSIYSLNQKLDVSNLPAGIYNISVDGDIKSQIHSFVKQ